MRVKVEMQNLTIVLWGVLSFFLCFENRVLFNILPFLQSVQRYGKLFVILILLLLVVFKRKRYSQTAMFISVIVIWNLIATALNGGSLISAVLSFGGMYLVCLLLEFANERPQMFTLLKTWLWIMIGLVLIDLFTELAFPNGLYTSLYYTNNWFLGYKTERIIYSLPMVILGTFITLEEKKKITLFPYALTALAFFDSFLSSATSGSVMYLAVFVIMITMDLVYRGKIRESKKIFTALLDYRLVITVYLFVIIVVVFFQNETIIADVSEYFGKNVGFSSRVYIWDACIEVICSNTFTGSGYISGSMYELLSGLRGGTNAHNMVLTILMNGGIVAGILYLLMLIFLFKRLDKNNGTVRLLLVFVYAILLLGITSSIIVYSTFGMTVFMLLERAGNSMYAVDTELQN